MRDEDKLKGVVKYKQQLGYKKKTLESKNQSETESFTHRNVEKLE